MQIIMNFFFFWVKNVSNKYERPQAEAVPALWPKLALAPRLKTNFQEK